MRHRYTCDVIEALIVEKHGTEVRMIKSTFDGLYEKATFVDVEYGEWRTKPFIVIHGHGHPLRGRFKTGNKLTLSISKVRDRLFERWGNLVTLDETTYVDRKTPAKFIDVEYGEWWAKPLHLLKGSGRHHLRVAASKSNARKIDVKTIAARVHAKHNGLVTLRENTYVDTHTKATFIDVDHGDWVAAPYSVLNGSSHPFRGLRKAIATMRKFKPVPHWKTGELCLSASGFENAVLQWLNHHEIDYDWQIPFQMPTKTISGKRNEIYVIDCFIKTGKYANTYIEIKGTWFRRNKNDGGRSKWEWFHNEFPNSMLWMSDDLIKLGIIDAKRRYLVSARE